jgi:hypothetical protein
MDQKSKIIFLTILIQFLFVPFGSQGFSFQENPLTKAIQLFDKEKYAEAEPLFKSILDNRPDDFMVNYFYGACRTENGHYGVEDLNYLLKASKEVNPLNIDYYLAVQYHAKNQWEKALAYYKLYQSVASANEQEKVGLALKMEQCANKVNPFSSGVEDVADIDVPGIGEEASTEVIAAKAEGVVSQTAASDPINVEIDEKTALNEEIIETPVVADSTNQTEEPEQDPLPTQIKVEEPKIETVKAIPANERIKFNVNNEITYLSILNFKTEEGKSYFDQGTSKEAELQKVMIRTEILREKYKASQSRAERDSIGQLILSLEGQAYDLKNDITNLFIQAKNSENSYWANASPEETERFIKELNLAAQKSFNSNKTANTPDASDVIIPPILIQNEEIHTETANTGEAGVIYKIQLGAYSRGIPNSLKAVFNKISVIRKVENYTDENGVVVYTTGNLTKYDDAVVMQKQVRQEGIKDPVIAAYFNGKRITLEQAKEIDNNQ